MLRKHHVDVFNEIEDSTKSMNQFVARSKKLAIQNDTH